MIMDEDTLYRVDKYRIRVRAKYVAYYEVDATSLCEAENKAKQLLFKQMNDEVDGVFDFEEYDEKEFQAHKELKQWSNSLNEKWGKNQ
tara:strand:- start:11 stop:274 length:264 start_codon:yes stop_codon:yes gene_type:complete